MNRPSIATSILTATTLGVTYSLGMMSPLIDPQIASPRGHDTNPFRRGRGTGKHARIRQRQNRSRRRSLRRP